MSNLIVDVESLAIHSDAVVLSAAILYFEFDKEYTYTELCNNTLFVKFNVKEQIKEYNRIIEKDTAEWWKKQSKIVREKSLIPSSCDMILKDGINAMREYIKAHCDPSKTIIWARGNIDSILVDSLCTAIGEPVLMGYNRYMDVRTAISLLAEESKSGYCDVSKEKFPDFTPNTTGLKHTPDFDCILDCMMLLSCV